MSNLSKRSTVYFEPNIHTTLRAEAAFSHCSISYLVNEAVTMQLIEDHLDLQAFADRKNDTEVSYEALLKKLGAYGKI
jgi:hypothetical protein